MVNDERESKAKGTEKRPAFRLRRVGRKRPLPRWEGPKSGVKIQNLGQMGRSVLRPYKSKKKQEPT